MPKGPVVETMPWRYVALIAMCGIAGVIVGVIVSQQFHITIWVAPALALANVVGVYFALKQKIDAQRS